MKRLLTIVITLSVMQSFAFASFPDTWNGVFFSSPAGAGDELPPSAMYHTFYLSGDTTISDVNYHKLYIDGHYPGQKGTLNHKYLAGIRVTSDEQQVYIQTNNEEYLLFDFSVNEGDTCHAYWGVEVALTPQDFENKQVVRDLRVLSKGSYNGYSTITLEDFKNSNDVFNKTTWIVGVGSTIGLTSYQDCCPGVLTPVLLCASQDGQQVYMAPDEAVSSWGYKNACPRVEVTTDLFGLTNEIKVSSPCYTILGTLAGDDYRGVVIQNGKIFIKQ